MNSTNPNRKGSAQMKHIGVVPRGKGIALYDFEKKKPLVGQIIKMYLPATHKQAEQGYKFTAQTVLVVENDLGELLYRKRLSGTSQGWVKKAVRFDSICRWSSVK